MTKSNQAQIMTRAWAMFREAYGYPAIKFSSIGRPCFNYCLRKAWAESRESAKLAAVSLADRTAQIESLASALALAPYSDARNYSGRADAIQSRIDRLQEAA